MVKSNAQLFEKEKDIRNYFDLMKPEWFCDFHPTYKKIVDVKNGYISFRTLENELEPIFQMALFKDSEGKDLIVIHVPGYACADIFDCANTEERKTYFLRYEDEEWVDVSQVVLPQIQTHNFYEDSNTIKIVDTYAPNSIAYQLPQYGQTIRLKLEICDGYINFDYPDEPVVSNEEIQKILDERKILLREWNKKLGFFQLRE